MSCRSLLVVLAACGGAARPLENATTRPSPTVAVTGTVRDAQTLEPLAGVTIIVTPVTGDSHPDAEVKPTGEAITDEHGMYKLELAPSRYDVTFYYADLTAKRLVDARAATTLDQQIDNRWEGGVVHRCETATAASCK
jgi:hypothetical protein